LVVLLLAAGVVSQGLWSPFAGHGWFEHVAYGLPAFAEGRWWTPITGPFFVIEPWGYAPTLLAFAGMGYLEWRRGSLVALRVFWLGQLVAILATALFIVALRPTGWPWVVGLAE